MDQFAAGFGRRNSALFLDCGTLKHEIVPFDTGNYRLIISNTNKRRGLTDSKYNERRAECEKAVELMQQYKKIDSLSDLTIEDLPHLKTYISDEIIVRRARHVITENDRVLRAVEALKKGNITEFGILMHQSHDSLKNDYEVTGHELDTLAYGARRFEGVAGSRMTGAGFGGCTISLVDATKVKGFIHHISEEYTKITGLTADFYTPSTGDGASMLE
jgi:galactokinase